MTELEKLYKYYADLGAKGAEIKYHNHTFILYQLNQDILRPLQKEGI